MADGGRRRPGSGRAPRGCSPGSSGTGRPGADVWRVREPRRPGQPLRHPGTARQDPAAVADPGRPGAGRSTGSSPRPRTRSATGSSTSTSATPATSRPPAGTSSTCAGSATPTTRDGGTRFLVSVDLRLRASGPDPFADHRAGFEVRTRLRCRRIEVRTHADGDALVRTTSWPTLTTSRGTPGRRPPNGASLLQPDPGRRPRRRRRRGAAAAGVRLQRVRRRSRRRIRPLTATGDALPRASLARRRPRAGRACSATACPTSSSWTGPPGSGATSAAAASTAPGADARGAGAASACADPGVQLADLDGDGRADLLAPGPRRLLPAGLRRAVEPRAGSSATERRPRSPLDDARRRAWSTSTATASSTRCAPARSRFELFFNDPPPAGSGVETRPAAAPSSPTSASPTRGSSSPT